MVILEGKKLCISYSKAGQPVVKDACIEIEKGQIVSIIGPNGSGKSTLLKALSRLIKPDSGSCLLKGQDIWTQDTKEIAKVMAILPQVKAAQSDVTVRQLVSFGRYPHKRFGASLSSLDDKIIEDAIERTRLSRYQDQYVSNLSGGEQQRAWIAMALAQNPEVLILDEPTTFLDIAHQLEVLEAVKSLNEKDGMTIVMVLHDINQAVRYSDKICALKDGEIVAFEKSDTILTEERIRQLYEIDGQIIRDPKNSYSFYIPEKSLRF